MRRDLPKDRRNQAGFSFSAYSRSAAELLPPAGEEIKDDSDLPHPRGTQFSALWLTGSPTPARQWPTRNPGCTAGVERWS